MSKTHYSEEAAEESLEKTALLKEIELVELVNNWQNLYDFVLSDPELLLTDQEKDFVFFFCSWAASILSADEIAPISLVALNKEEDRFWTAFDKQKDQQKVSDYIFEYNGEEELLAIVEDAFHPVEDELDGISSRELQDILLVKFAVIFNFLRKDRSQ